MDDRFRTVFEFAPDAYYLNDLKGNFVDGNRIAEQVTGYQREELIGKNFLELKLLPPSQLPKAAAHLAKNAMGYPTGPDTFFLNRKDGEQVEVEIRTHPVTIGGQPLVLGIARDVTERQKLQRQLEKAREELETSIAERTAELKASEERYRAVIEQSLDCIFLADIKTKRILDANRSFRKTLGYSAEEIEGLTLYDFVAHEPAEIDKKCEEIVEKGALFLYERNYRHKDGSTIPLEISVSVISTPDGDVFCVVSRDVTKRKTAEEEKQRMYEQLLHAQKMEAVGIFAGGVAHDFNNMMTAILGRAQLARLWLEEDHRANKEVQEIERAAESAVDLTRQLLLFSRQQPARIRALNVVSIIDGMVGMLSRLMGEDVQVVIEGKRDVWTVQADKGNIEQLVMNLSTNARDAMPEGGTLRIHVWNIDLKKDSPISRKSGRSGRFVRISISDEGTGMDAETVARIFEPFYTTKPEAAGTGLGLSVVRGIVEDHDGWIDVVSTPGKGSDFRVYLPAVPDVDAEETTTEFTIERYLGNGERILLVEDDGRVRDFTTKTLTYGRYDVKAVSSAEDALDILEAGGESFDLVLSDIVLPGMSGIDLVEGLLKRMPGLKVLLASGYTDQKSEWSQILDKGIPFLPKPYDVAQLLRHVWKTIHA
jgi:PAS domain S-box-containing protein